MPGEGLTQMLDINDVRARLAAGDFEYSQHALRRAVERNISEREVREIATALELVEDYPDDKYSPSCLAFGMTKSLRPLHLQVCYTDQRMLKIITIYEPSPIDWDDYRIRRPR